MSVFITFIALSIVVFIHELGHLLAAKYGGIGVYEFSVGMGPKLFGFRYRDTDYNFRLFPLGGFVKLAGLDDKEGDAEEIDELKFQNRPMKWRMLTICAGSFFNVCLGYLVFFLLFFMVGSAVLSPVIKEVTSEGSANNAGLQTGDRLIALNNVPIVDVSEDFIGRLQDESAPLFISYERDSELKHVYVKPFFDEERDMYRIGIVLESSIQSVGFTEAVQRSFVMTGTAMQMVFRSFGMLFSGEASFKDLSGPIGIVQVASFQLVQNIASFLSIMAYISIALGVINMFPIPVLDGGHFMFLCYELLVGRSVPKKVGIALTNFFAVCLFVLMLFVVFNDLRFWDSRVDQMEMIRD